MKVYEAGEWGKSLERKGVRRDNNWIYPSISIDSFFLGIKKIVDSKELSIFGKTYCFSFKKLNVGNRQKPLLLLGKAFILKKYEWLGNCL